MAKTVCDLVVDCLTDWGVDPVFGLPALAAAAALVAAGTWYARRRR